MAITKLEFSAHLDQLVSRGLIGPDAATDYFLSFDEFSRGDGFLDSSELATWDQLLRDNLYGPISETPYEA